MERAESGYVEAVKSRDPQGQAEEEKRLEKAEREPDRQGYTSLMYQTPTPNEETGSCRESVFETWVLRPQRQGRGLSQGCYGCLLSAHFLTHG